MLRHHDVAQKKKSKLAADPGEFFDGEVAGLLGSQERTAFVATEGQKMKVTSAVKAAQTVRHKKPEDPPSSTEGGAPSVYIISK